MDEPILNVGQDAAQNPVITRATDPVASNVALPADFTAQYPQPLDTTEILAMCEDITLWRDLPAKRTALKAELWREMTSLEFTSGSSYVAFADYVCPEEYQHNGENRQVDIKNIGLKKSLGERDIMHSAAIAAANWNGINNLVGPSASIGLPGQSDIGTFQRQTVADLKAKEMRLGSTLLMNQWDRLLAVGNSSNNSLEFDGIETLVTSANGAHVRAASAIAASGTFAASDFDRFLSEACAAPTDVFGHPQAVQEMLSSYFQLWGAGTQVINVSGPDRITPGYNFSSEVRTGIGTLRVHADKNFTRSASGAASFSSSLYPLRMVHNGEPLVYRVDQIPLMFKDLTPGCTSISFMIYAATALVVKAYCAQNRWQGVFSGRVVSSCPTIY
jgi:hypothetical protein